MRKIKLIRFSSIILLVICSFSNASTLTFEDLDKLQQERYYYQAQAAVNAAKKAANVDSNIDVAPINNGENQINQRTGDSLPSLVKINGRSAVFLFADGTSRSVTAGQMLPGGIYQVMSVTINGVSVKRITDGKTYMLN